ncbi:hypothetical protein QR680_006507 [Steinernema hermaphroditum]|uniref:Autophagy-related protein n=1 Tax=Steinernema hermaphroditum TaxID=289476 RepID=A0AA39HVT1_9BILA|nr:hypothetical protein QR680_006507 [Steinernema hermaphroditum]
MTSAKSSSQIMWSFPSDSSGEAELIDTKPVDRRSFKERYSLQRRKAMAAKYTEKSPDLVPVICEKASHSCLEGTINSKYTIAADITVAKFLMVIRQKLNVRSDESIFLFVDNSLPPATLTIGQLHGKYVDEDGFLYLTYQGESVYGN